MPFELAMRRTTSRAGPCSCCDFQCKCSRRQRPIKRRNCCHTIASMHAIPFCAGSPPVRAWRCFSYAPLDRPVSCQPARQLFTFLESSTADCSTPGHASAQSVTPGPTFPASHLGRPPRSLRLEALGRFGNNPSFLNGGTLLPENRNIRVFIANFCESSLCRFGPSQLLFCHRPKAGAPKAPAPRDGPRPLFPRWGGTVFLTIPVLHPRIPQSREFRAVFPRTSFPNLPPPTRPSSNFSPGGSTAIPDLTLVVPPVVTQSLLTPQAAPARLAETGFRDFHGAS